MKLTQFLRAKKLWPQRAELPAPKLDDGLREAMVEAFADYERESTVRTISPAGLDLIKEFEGFHKDLGDGRVKAYPDPATGGKPWTIGWGSTGPHIGPDTIWTHEQAEAQLLKHVGEFEADVRKMAPTTTQGQFDALVSFAYNLGSHALKRSTLLKKHNAGEYVAAALEFPKWRFANGKPMRGLERRRAAEARLYKS
jgi:lysozyme